MYKTNLGLWVHRNIFFRLTVYTSTRSLSRVVEKYSHSWIWSLLCLIGWSCYCITPYIAFQIKIAEEIGNSIIGEFSNYATVIVVIVV